MRRSAVNSGFEDHGWRRFRGESEGLKVSEAAQNCTLPLYTVALQTIYIYDWIFAQLMYDQVQHR